MSFKKKRTKMKGDGAEIPGAIRMKYFSHLCVVPGRVTYHIGKVIIPRPLPTSTHTIHIHT